ncbi:ECF-type sigma factor [Roseateles sp.]|uniref:ECF-type sigma factor n=1 Tax=Roseateles sp. TaxID=1971397 RepID=UPI0032647B4A
MATDDSSTVNVTALLAEARSGSEQALPKLFETLYNDLQRIARRRLKAGAPITMLDTGALVHESFERFSRLQQLAVSDRGHFLSYAARVMRSIVIDAARERAAQRRGGAAEHVTLTESLGDSLAQPETEPDVLRVHEALETLASIDARLAEVVEMRYFGGLSNAEIAEALGVGLRTVERDWERARSFMFATMGGGAPLHD